MYITCMHGMAYMYFLAPDKYNRTKLPPLVSFLSRRESIPTGQEFALAKTSDAESLVSREPVKRLFFSEASQRSGILKSLNLIG